MSKQEITYTLMHGAGNMFIIINNDEYHLTIKELAEFMTKEFPLHFPVDGLMAYSSAHNSDFDFSIEFLNPDGSHGAMCGNGARCAIKYHVEHIHKSEVESCSITFQMAGTLYMGIYQQFGASIAIIFPNQPKANELNLSINDTMFNAIYVYNGSDHLIIDAIKHDIDADVFFTFDFHSMAEPLRHHTALPNGANVNLAMIMPNDLIQLRTFERGVERETAACGTGALATAFVYATFVNNDNLSSFEGTYPIRLKVQSGDILTVDKHPETGQLSLIGPAEFLTIEEAFSMYTDFQQRIQ